LIIEVDGDVHEHQKEYDKNRDSYLVACGYTVLRFKTRQIVDMMDEVLDTIRRTSNIQEVPLRGI
jgi:very-short-patch-repair endonuclease